MKLLNAMATVAGLTGLSRIAGFIRDVLTASILGAGPLADAFFVALKLPNFFRRVTAEGAFSVSFVPVYSETLEKDGAQEARIFASNIFMMMLGALSVFTILIMLAMPFVIYGIAPGFQGDPLRYDLAVDLSRITFPYLLFMSLTALLGGVLNAHNKFAPFAFAPVLFNLSLIAALLASDMFESAGHALAWGVLGAGFLQLAYLWISAARAGLPIKFVRPHFTARTNKVLRLMGPGVIGAGVMHINLFADLIIASFLQTGAISYLYYADRLNQLPLGVVGIAVGTALLPMLSRAFTAKDVEESRNLYNRALEYCLILALPAALALGVLAQPIIQVLFERGAFDAADTAATAGVLMAYALGLPAYISVKVFSTAHWARQDTVTPVKIAIKATLTNIALSLILIQFMGVMGIALATGLTGWLQFAMHVRSLRQYDAVRFDIRLKRNVRMIALASCLMAGSLFIVLRLMSDVFVAGFSMQILALAALIGIGFAVYAGLLLATKTVRISDLKRYLKPQR